MTTEWLLTMKPAFVNQLIALPSKEMAQVQKKVAMLVEDPTPDAKVKKKLKYMDGDLHRLRSGDYRIFYTYRTPYVSVLSLVRRDDDTYDETVPPEFLGGLDPELKAEKTDKAWDRWTAPQKKETTPLPAPLSKVILDNLAVPETHHARLIGIDTQDKLLDVQGVPDDILLKIDEALIEKPLDELMRQPDLIANDVDDLLRFKEKELLGFLLRLNPEQEKYVAWAKNAKGPTLLKGGPGTGKSTVALYRARTMLDVLKKAGVESPRILFTTYTQALVRFSAQLLKSLLGDDAGFIEVRTADSLARRIADRHVPDKVATSQELQRALRTALDTVKLEGNALEVRAQAKIFDRLGPDYLLEEIVGVIQGRGYTAIDAYLNAARPGREQPLNKVQRRAVWALSQRLAEVLADRSLGTYTQIRATANGIVRRGDGPPAYDGVIIDEAQDLDPVLISMLTHLVKEPGRLFLTADANQSIYGAGFRWSDVHEDLKFVGRAGVLRANHRSTKEAGEAARAYLAGGLLDDDAPQPTYVHAGPPPAVRAVESPADESALLARFLPAAAREFRLGLGACAVLVPSKDAGRDLADDLDARGVRAKFMASRDLDLSYQGVKVMPLQAAKGLEFPIVALAGFLDGRYPYPKVNDTPEMIAEKERRARRTLYVAMTRAMRALLVIVPADGDSLLFTGFDQRHWNLKLTSSG